MKSGILNLLLVLMTFVGATTTLVAGGDEGGEYNAAETAIHHIGDAHVFHIVGDISIPLPCIAYSKEDGLSFFMASKFHHGENAYKGYVLDHDVMKRVKDSSFPKEAVEVEGFKEKDEAYFVTYKGKDYEIERASNLFSFTSWVDFSITKVVFTMLLAALLLCFIFFRVAKAYKNRAGHAPKGLQSLMEPVITFMIDEAIKPIVGPKYEKYLPYLLTLFFFILASNLLGLIPFFPGSANVTGNIAITMTLALFTFFITTFSANKHYWGHIFWMPGAPVFVKPILAVIEFIGIFVKPFSLMIRLFANITGGHIIILSLVGLIFIFGKSGESIGGAAGGAVVSFIFVLFMNCIELLVAFLQAFIFVVLSSLYIGSAIEEHH